MTTAPVRAQDDLFRHVNGAWLDSVEIPADRPVDGAVYRLRDQAELDCRALTEAAAALTDPVTGSPEQLIGALYRSFMDTEAVEARGIAPFAGMLAQAAAVRDVAELFRVVGELQRRGVRGVLHLDVDTDPADPDRYVLNLWQGGLGLPDESYYSDERHSGIREAYRAHLPAVLRLGGLDRPDARSADVIELETELARGHWDRVRSRDDTLTYNPTDRAGLNGMLPAELWDAWMDGLRAPAGVLDRVVVRQPDYLTALAALLTPDRLPAWRSWLSWNILRAGAPFGPAELVERNFDFYGRTLSGIPELRERWKRGVGFVEAAAGEALGRLYVERHFPPTAKRRMDDLVANLLEAYRRDITELPWMTEDTKVRALEKLDAFTAKIGYPNRWRDYSGLLADPGDLAGNVARAAAFELDRQLGKLGGPVDREEWFMSPQTVNAYYNPGMNEIVFPAAILQPPLFDADGGPAENYGAIGAIIGHEVGHGFDDQGSKFDGRGALRDWWSPADRAAFEKLTARLIQQYDGLQPVATPGHSVNGALTIGENIGDLGGLGVAYQGWRIALAGAEPEIVDGLTGAQRFFLAWARAWQFTAREAEVLRRLTLDPHSPPEFRCNQVVRNIDEFHEAFDVRPGDGLWLEPSERVRIW